MALTHWVELLTLLSLIGFLYAIWAESATPVIALLVWYELAAALGSAGSALPSTVTLSDDLKGERRWLAMMLLIGAILPIPFILDRAKHNAGLALVGLAALLCIYYYIAHRVCAHPDVESQGTEGYLNVERRLNILLIILLVAAPLFGLWCRALYRIDNTAFLYGGQEDTWNWISYGLDNLMDVLLFGLGEIYDLHLSEIAAGRWSARTGVFAFRLLTALLLVEAIVRYWRYIRRRVRGFSLGIMLQRWGARNAFAGAVLAVGRELGHQSYDDSLLQCQVILAATSGGQFLGAAALALSRLCRDQVARRARGRQV